MSKHSSILQALKAPAADRGGDLAAAAWVSFLQKAKRPDEADRIMRENPRLARVFENGGRVDKADQTVGATGAGSWGANLTQSAVGAFFSALGAQSAGAQLVKAAGAHVELAPLTSISFPRSAAAPAPVSWIGEGAPIPLDEHAFGEDTIGPERKFGVILTLTRELAKRSAGRAVFDAVLRERAAISLDAAIFNTAAGDDVVHPGILAGLTPVSPYGAPEDDVALLLSSLAAAGGSGNAALVCHPTEAAILQARMPTLKVPVWPSRAVAQGTLIALDPTGFAVSFGAVDIETAESATLHMHDTPAEIVSGTGPTTADPVREVYQTATIAVRLLVDIAFVQRNGLVVFAEGVSW
ncbi:hypothetical protein LG047_02480 [Methylocystis sp. WRRC1]|uniref:hypothetical protein n=1 Tax=Methylocystis sp. WRRC1 TaxID=1732014 RepID=UPI001D146E0B|nr:hypothetical protein [Methylocystis sp. WRRC1]MCC3243757.1 hypothetical protein [Methylocystis sp. WRRC1]MCC3244198.1 hypothetical protein [Methylocystis sp. WRRC1]